MVGMTTTMQLLLVHSSFFCLSLSLGMAVLLTMVFKTLTGLRSQVFAYRWRQKCPPNLLLLRPYCSCTKGNTNQSHYHADYRIWTLLCVPTRYFWNQTGTVLMREPRQPQAWTWPCLSHKHMPSNVSICSIYIIQICTSVCLIYMYINYPGVLADAVCIVS